MNFHDKVFEAVKNTFKDWIDGTEDKPYNIKFNIIDMADLSLKKYGGAKFNFSHRKETFGATISIVKDVKTYCGNNFMDRSSEFVSTYNIIPSIYTHFIFTLLHEIGHLKLMDGFIRSNLVSGFKGASQIPGMIAVTMAPSEESLRTFKETTNVLLHQALDGWEGYADNFALKNFKKIYDQVKEYIPEGGK